MKKHLIDNELAGTGAMSLVLNLLYLLERKGVLTKQEVSEFLIVSAKDLPNEDKFSDMETMMKELIV